MSYSADAYTCQDCGELYSPDEVKEIATESIRERAIDKGCCPSCAMIDIKGGIIYDDIYI
jgi:RecJ-like exonuclease